MRITNVGATLRITEDIVRVRHQVVEIPAGTEIGINTNAHATAAAPPSASSIGSVKLSSRGITVKKDGAPVVAVKAIQVAGGVVRVTALELLGEAKKAAETEEGLLRIC